MKRVARIAALILLGLTVVAVGLWCTTAIYFSNLPGEIYRIVAASVFGGGFLLAFLFLPGRRRTFVGFAVASVSVFVWWWLIPASHDRDWQIPWGVLPHAEIDGDKVVIRNIRNFDYKTENDYTVRYYDRTFDLKDLETVDFVKSHWDNLEDIAHTLLSFGFRDGAYVVVSVETRLEKGEIQSGLGGIFKQHELIYVLGDERDLIRLRTNFRGEEVFLYPTTSPPEDVRVVFVDILKKVNDIYDNPQFYNTITQNCTTSLVPHLELVRERRVS